MLHKVFLVEDEIMTREGIRDSVRWNEVGYQFCGEAPDGELALPLIRERQPDVIITDIKMPFMDGLQLSRTVRETMPATKIIILSGHDEFRYAQEAIHIGVTEYLLKPLSAHELGAALRRVGSQIEHERVETTRFAALQARLSDQDGLLRERCILNMLVGHGSSTELIAQCQQAGIDLVAPWYQALLVRADAHTAAQDDRMQRLNQTIANVLQATPGCLWCKQDLVSTGVILRGERMEQVQQASQRVAACLRAQIATLGMAGVAIGIGAPVERIAAIAQSFMQASATHHAAATIHSAPDTAVLEQLLQSGLKADIPQRVRAYLQPLGHMEHPAHAAIDRALADGVNVVATTLRGWGAPPERIIPAAMPDQIASYEQAHTVLGGVLEHALDYRDRQTHHQALLIDRARAYIEAHYADEDISLNVVAAAVTLSPSYFSMIFAREVGQTFVEFLTNVRVRHAIALLRTTALTSSEIAARVGYQNPRYFHTVFRKATNQSPIAFRSQI